AAQVGEGDTEHVADAVEAAEREIAAAQVALHGRFADAELRREFAVGHAARAQAGADRFQQQFRLGHGASSPNARRVSATATAPVAARNTRERALPLRRRSAQASQPRFPPGSPMSARPLPLRILGTGEYRPVRILDSREFDARW